jgi:hypothetical protein
MDRRYVDRRLTPLVRGGALVPVMALRLMVV